MDNGSHVNYRDCCIRESTHSHQPACNAYPIRTVPSRGSRSRFLLMHDDPEFLECELLTVPLHVAEAQLRTQPKGIVCKQKHGLYDTRTPLWVKVQP
jgi:hypothetical protein